MQFFKKINLFHQCRSLGVALWECPQFIFLVMGVVIVATILATYQIGQEYIDSQIVALILLLLTGFLLTVSYIIVNAFERIVFLRQSESKQSEEMIRLKDQFVFIAAHELRTPATAIKWGVKMLRDEKELGPIKAIQDILDFINKSNERLLTLVQDVLETARLQGGTIHPNLAPMSILQAYESAMRELEGEAFLRKVKVENKIPADISPVLSDEMRLKEVFLNLISNAIKYSEPGGLGRVEVKAQEEGEKVVVSVWNNGKGIPTDEQGHVFEKFWRAKDARQVEGTGLGLFIVRQLATLMNGDVRFSSSPGNTSFFVILRKPGTRSSSEKLPSTPRIS